MSAQPLPSSTENPRGIPGWAVLLILLVCISAGGWGAWKYWQSTQTPPPDELVDVRAIGPAALPNGWAGGPRRGNGNGGGGALGRFAAQLSQNVPNGVLGAGDNYVVSAGVARLNITRQPNADWRYRFSYTTSIGPADQLDVLRAQTRVLRDPAAAEKLGVTADQVAQLRGAQGNANMIVGNNDRDQIKQLFLAYVAAAGTSRPTSGPSAATQAAPSPAARAAAEHDLVAAFDALGKRQLDPTKQAFAKRIDHIKAILGPELFQKLKQPG